MLTFAHQNVEPLPGSVLYLKIYSPEEYSGRILINCLEHAFQITGRFGDIVQIPFRIAVRAIQCPSAVGFVESELGYGVVNLHLRFVPSRSILEQSHRIAAELIVQAHLVSNVQGNAQLTVRPHNRVSLMLNCVC